MQQEEFPEFRIHSFGSSFVYRSFYRQLVWDVLWGGLASAVVYAYVSFHVKSFFISSFSMSMILYSFPITLVIYKLMMGITCLAPLHLMIVFVILGISADNIFVLWDAWGQSDTYPQFSGNLHKRMAYTFRRASKALLATTSTTAFAFFSNGFSSLMPVSAFGFFAAVVVPVNYVLIVFYFPAFIIVYETTVRSWEQRAGVCCIRCIRCVWCRNTSRRLRKAWRKKKGNQITHLTDVEMGRISAEFRQRHGTAESVQEGVEIDRESQDFKVQGTQLAKMLSAGLHESKAESKSFPEDRDHEGSLEVAPASPEPFHETLDQAQDQALTLNAYCAFNEPSTRNGVRGSDAPADPQASDRSAALLHMMPQ